tara:strand:- start:63 stop:302 length:240 start_codon:yes stop_codon:yes gene_type:complete
MKTVKPTIIRKVENLEDVHYKLLDVFQQIYDGKMDTRKGMVLAKVTEQSIRALLVHKMYEQTEINATASNEFNLKVTAV